MQYNLELRRFTMLVAFVVLFVLSSQLIHSIAVDQRSGFSPYPLGSTILCMLMHPILFAMSVFYLGWLWGIVLFLLHLFGIIHMTISWVCELPTLLTRNPELVIGYMRFKVLLLTPMLVTILVFIIVSFLCGEFESLLILLQNNPKIIINSTIIVVLLSAFRLVVARLVDK